MARGRDSRGRFVAVVRDFGVAGREPSRDEVMQVQRRKWRAGSWTEANKVRFLQTLAATCNVAEACRQGKTTYVTAYRHRKEDAAFRKAWRSAIAEGYARLEIEMLERALIAEQRVRSAVADAATDKDALELLAKYPARTAELLYRVHRQAALEEDAGKNDPDGEKSLIALREKIEAIRRQVLAEEGQA